MGQRAELQALFESLTDHVYFQPPPTVKMEYPCIVYRRDFALTYFADDKPYKHGRRYQVIVIDRSPDSPIPDKIRDLQYCIYDRFYTADNLNHDVFKLFF
jgi:hypothetical protein